MYDVLCICEDFRVMDLCSSTVVRIEEGNSPASLRILSPGGRNVLSDIEGETSAQGGVQQEHVQL